MTHPTPGAVSDSLGSLRTALQMVWVAVLVSGAWWLAACLLLDPVDVHVLDTDCDSNSYDSHNGNYDNDNGSDNGNNGVNSVRPASDTYKGTMKTKKVLVMHSTHALLTVSAHTSVAAVMVVMQTGSHPATVYFSYCSYALTSLSD